MIFNLKYWKKQFWPIANSKKEDKALLLLLTNCFFLLAVAALAPAPYSKSHNTKVVLHEQLSSHAMDEEELSNKWANSEEWQDSFLKAQLSSRQSALDTNYGHWLAQTVYQNSFLSKSRGKCLRWVKKAFNETNTKHCPKRSTYENLNLVGYDFGRYQHNYYPALSAHMFYKWAKDNPVTLCHKMRLADITDRQDLHESMSGLIHIYKRGRCGFHKIYGHIEILTDPLSKTACSDHCRVITSCKPDMVLAPVNHCNWINMFSRKSPKTSTLSPSS